VLSDVPAHCTVAGVPAKPVRGSNCEQPALSMDHRFVK
jgi:serine O-acetyltransferase